jgi:hypothetical protein
METSTPENQTPNGPQRNDLPAGRRFGWHFWAIMVALGVAGAAVLVPIYFVRPRGEPPKYPCAYNLRQIDIAVQQWAYEHKVKDTDQVVEVARILGYLKGGTLPVCPQHGTYSVTTLSARPTCTVATKGHVYEQLSP